MPGTLSKLRPGYQHPLCPGLTASTPSPNIDLFLSYNRQDQDAVLQVRRKLELRGISHFFDRDDLLAGLPWPQALEQALLSSRG